GGSTTSTPKKNTRPLPRRQTVKAAAKTAATAKGKGARKVNPPDSGDRFFNPQEGEIDEEELARQTRLFTSNLNTSGFDTEDDVEDIRYTMKGIKIKREATEDEHTALKLKSVHDKDEPMNVDSEPSLSPDELRAIQDKHLDNLLEMNVHDKGKDSSIGVLDYSTPEALDPVLLPTYSGLPHVNPCRVDCGNYGVVTTLLNEGIFSEDKFKICQRSLLRAVLYAGGLANPEDDPFVINPASKSKVLRPKTTGKAVPTRFICVDVVVVIDCHVVHSTNVFRDTSKIVKQLIG
ncbi:hypothetical protein L226DRAFT_527772, partial [Lentinus tigrinus ALCF2SS1-7]|uniref:uncharacterized protein n=1 Tax=Lentinus tigrinus ALCF2SS1-7 TaxID=1328758 RepID=UPI0011663ACF